MSMQNKFKKTKILSKCKKAQVEELIKILLWAIIFALLILGVYFLVKRISSIA